ncbi:transcription factor ETV7-like [Discoglossus pictus]
MSEISPHAAGNKEWVLTDCPVRNKVYRQIPQSVVSCRTTDYSFTDEVIWKLPGRLRIHPTLWSKDDVTYWLRWAENEYSLSRTDDKKFVMNGRALCILTKDDFKNRCPSSGDVLYELITYIRTQRQALIKYPFFSQAIGNMHVLQSLKYMDKAKPSIRYDTIKPLTMVNNPHEDGPINLSYKVQKVQTGVVLKLNSTSSETSVDGKIQDCRLLWDYLYHLLSDKRYEPYIKWEDKESKIFRVVDPNKLAALWGNHKNRPNMTYEKMSRALRQYYKLHFLKKEFGQKLVFRFLKSPGEILASKSDKLLQLESQDLDTFDYDNDVIEVIDLSP